MNPIDKIKNMPRKNDYLIGIDSDGCIFDSMEIKHKECFIPNIINDFELQYIAKYVRETAEFVNLYSAYRGINRFPGLVMVFDMLEKRPEVLARGYKIPEIQSLRDWLAEESKLGNPALEAKIAKCDDEVLKHVLQWSYNVNNTVSKIVRGVPPFPLVVDALKNAQAQCDMLVVSGTPVEALTREWKEHGIYDYVSIIGGQEMGSKKEMLAAARLNKNYKSENCLMIGDAWSDYKSAAANDLLFFPINPGHEELSWERFYNEAYDKFINNTYAGKYQDDLIAEFSKYLPEKASWKTI